jgi:hypothetical protein
MFWSDTEYEKLSELEKTKIIDLAIERTQLTGLTLDRLTASIASFKKLFNNSKNATKMQKQTIFDKFLKGKF